MAYDPLSEALRGLGDKGQKVIGQTYKLDDKGNRLYYGGNFGSSYGGMPAQDQWNMDLERQAMDLNREALSQGDLSNWNLYDRASAPQFGPSGMPLTSQGSDSIKSGKVWMPDANDPAAKFFTPEALKALYLQGGAGTDGGYGKVNVGSLDQYLGSGAKDYLMSQGIEGADDDKHKITFYDPTQPYWGVDAFKEKSKLRGNAESLAKAVGTAVAMYAGGAAIAGAAGGLGGAGAVGATEGAGTAGGLGLSEMSTALPAMEAMPNFGAVVSPYAAEGAATAAGGAGWSMSTPGSLTEAMNGVGATDALTIPTQGTGLVNAGGGLEGLTSAGMGTGSSGYPMLDATAGAGTDSMSSSLLDNLKDYATDKLKNPNTYKDLLKMFGQGDQQQGYNSALSSALRGGTGPMRSLQGGAAGGQWFNPNS